MYLGGKLDILLKVMVVSVISSNLRGNFYILPYFIYSPSSLFPFSLSFGHLDLSLTLSLPLQTSALLESTGTLIHITE